MYKVLLLDYVLDVVNSLHPNNINSVTGMSWLQHLVQPVMTFWHLDPGEQSIMTLEGKYIFREKISIWNVTSIFITALLSFLQLLVPASEENSVKTMPFPFQCLLSLLRHLLQLVPECGWTSPKWVLPLNRFLKETNQETHTSNCQLSLINVVICDIIFCLDWQSAFFLIIFWNWKKWQTV